VDFNTQNNETGDEPAETDLRAAVIRLHTANTPKVLRPDAAFWKAFGFDLRPMSPDVLEWDGDPESHFDRHPDHIVGAILPESVVGFRAATSEDNEALRAEVKRLGPPMLVFKAVGCQHYFYRVASGLVAMDTKFLPDGIVALTAGSLVSMPSGEDFDAAAYRGTAIEDLSEIVEPNSLVERVTPPTVDTPLAAYSLIGRASEFEAKAIKAEALLGDIALSGQATVVYAPPNAGKTLITLYLVTEAVGAKRLAPANGYYINADDDSHGFATKMRLMDDIGVHTLSPGHKGFRADGLVTMLDTMANEDQARGIVIVLDTLKKFVDLMHKGRASTFAHACRKFVMAGGTVLALAHTNKNASSSGGLVYGGTADILQDFDAAYILTPREGENGDRVAEFEAKKRRGGSIASVAYAYTGDGDISYEERLASVRLVDAAYLNNIRQVEADRADEQVIAAIRTCIGLGIAKKMELAKAAAKRAEVSERSVIRVIDAHTGDQPGKHHWRYEVKDRGAKVYQLLENKMGISEDPQA
jgi:hypothetical protein